MARRLLVALLLILAAHTSALLAHGTCSPTAATAARGGGAAPRMMGRRAVARARGKELNKARLAAVRENVHVLRGAAGRHAAGGGAAAADEEPRPQVELVRQNYARLTYANGTSVEVHTPSLRQEQHGAWLAVRAALEITASEFAAARDAWRFASREQLLRRKLEGTRWRGNAATAWGLKMEPLAIAQYERMTGHAVAPTGLHTHANLRWGASPDGLVTTAQGGEGLLEVKCSYKLRAKGEAPQPTACPPEYYDQIQGQLAIVGREWCDLVIFVPPLAAAKDSRNACVLRVRRDPHYFERTLVPHLESFGEQLRQRRAQAADAADDAARAAEALELR